ncbi:MAG: hypothetical protein LH628_10760 [Microcoleus sp. CAN_BIN18]|nr:hypothetical protein [Microcoleus sp. CAN_BIN18]
MALPECCGVGLASEKRNASKNNGIKLKHNKSALDKVRSVYNKNNKRDRGSIEKLTEGRINPDNL